MSGHRPPRIRIIQKETAAIAEPSTARRGVAMVAALVCLLLVMTIGALTLQSLARQHRQRGLAQRRLQARLLVDSALDRAAAALRRSPQYQGETWEIDAQQLDGRHAAAITISVQVLDQPADARRVTARVVWPPESTPPIAWEQQIIIDLKHLNQQGI